VESVAKLLPPDAKVIEVADLSSVAGMSRAFVLWMSNPKWSNFGDDKHGKCSDIVHGDFGYRWDGPTRLSLVDPVQMRLINTIEIRVHWFGYGPGEDKFTLPLCVLDPYPRTPDDSSDKIGKSNMALMDLTGDGMKAEFALFEFEAFGIADTSVFGYSQRSDRAVQYPVEVLGGSEKPRSELWVEQIFARKPIRPGYWNFTWEPGHGSSEIIHEEVSFDQTREMFVDRREYKPWKSRQQ
jgi:hypothetical protein